MPLIPGWRAVGGVDLPAAAILAERMNYASPEGCDMCFLFHRQMIRPTTDCPISGGVIL